MPVERIFAHLSCSDLARAVAWYERLFGRAPDARPMDGLVEWHHRDHAGLQLFEDAASAGHGTMTLIVADIAGEHARLRDGGLATRDVEAGDTVSLVRLSDPDGNLVVLAEPGRV